MGKVQVTALVVLVAVWLAVMGAGAAFIYQHGRFPMGSGEVANWIWGL